MSHAEFMIELLTQELILAGWPKDEAKQEAKRMWNNRYSLCSSAQDI